MLTLSIAPRVFVDATKKGNVFRFVANSCSPNCEIQVWWVLCHFLMFVESKSSVYSILKLAHVKCQYSRLVNGRIRACLVSLCPIAENEEITVVFCVFISVSCPLLRSNLPLHRHHCRGSHRCRRTAPAAAATAIFHWVVVSRFWLQPVIFRLRWVFILYFWFSCRVQTFSFSL